MPETVETTQVNTTVENTKADVNPNDSLLGGEDTTTQQAQTQETSKVDPALTAEAKAKADADAKAAYDKLTPEQKAEADKAAAEAKAKEGAPADGKYDLKAPEGVTLDPEGITKLSAIAKELNLSNEKAQKFADLAVEHTKKVTSQLQEQTIKQWDATRKSWREEVQKDQEFGGDNLKVSRDLALRAIDRFGGKPEEVASLKKFFAQGVGDNPGLFRVFARVGKALSEDRLVDGSQSTPQLSDGDVIYGKKQ